MSNKKSNKKRLAWGLITVLLLLFMVPVCYFAVYYKAMDVEAYLKSDTDVKVEKIKAGWFFDGIGEDKALIFYPGAKVEASAYAPLMYQIAKEADVDCFLIEMPCNFAIFGINKADDVVAQYSYDHWYISGHSLGGAMACTCAAKHADVFDGLILMGAYVTADMTQTGVPSLVMYGSEDGVLSRDKLTEGRNMMSAGSEEICIEGGNHAYFGSYGEQKGDGVATISPKEQWNKTVEEIKVWMN